VVVNADESEPGTFKDRVIMEGDPYALVEALVIAAEAVGAGHGWIYVRGEYPTAAARLRHATAEMSEAGLLGDVVVEVRDGGGAYICGEETALFNSIEGFRGEPRNKPPYPTTHGLFGLPTVVNNVETLVNVPHIVLEGSDAFAAIGTPQSTGTRLFCLSGHVRAPGLYEHPFGVTVSEAIAAAGGLRAGRSLTAVLLGGAAGTFIGPDQLDLALTFEDTMEAGVALGSGVVMVFDDTTDLNDTAVRIAEFFAHESCGQCVPCRIGTRRQVEMFGGRSPGSARVDISNLDDLAAVMADASICGLGHTASSAITSAVRLGLLDATPRPA
jgi:NADH-quinone oxidoreductase subunit F